MGTPDFGEFERNQPHNMFNDRRIGGKAKNRAVGESMYGSKKQPPKGGNRGPSAGGTNVPRKPKPKFPTTPMALKIK
jgi:hypothetical protein